MGKGGGGILGDVLTVGGDLLAAGTGNAWAIPLINAGVSTGEGLAQGESFGKAIGQGAISGGEALAGQEIAGAFGVGEGNSAFNKALGITGDNPAGTGLPDIGAMFSGTSNTPGAANTSSTPTTSPGTGGVAGQVTGVPASAAAPAAGGGVGGGAGAGAAPATASTDVSQAVGDTNYGNVDQAAGSLSSATSASNAVNPGGGANAGTQGVGSGLTGQFQAAAGGPPTLNSSGIDAAASSVGNAGAASGGSSWTKALTSPGALFAGGGLALDAAKQYLGPAPKGTRQLEQIAGSQAAQGQQLEGYLQSGKLPPGLQAGIDQASNSAKAAIRSKYAAMGASGSSAEQQELAAIDQNAQAQGAQYAMQLLQTGISETGASAGLYQALLNGTLSQDNELSNAIASFSGAASGGTKQQSTTSG